MIAFCTHCFREIDAEDRQCHNCGADLRGDSRSYEEKLVAALAHPMPEARLRICWLLGINDVRSAVPNLMHVAERDPDLFVRKSAVEALVALRDPRSYSLLHDISEGDNYLLRSAAKKVLEDIDATKGFHP
jgi:HEAT repeat protein